MFNILDCIWCTLCIFADNKAKTGTFGGFYDAKEDKKLEKRKNSDGEQDEVNNKRVKSEERDNKQNKCCEYSAVLNININNY